MNTTKQNQILDSLDACRAKIAKHTPGPWEIGRSYSSTHATPIRWQGENLAWVCGLDSAHEFSKEQTMANARLIASAPELLAALRVILDATGAAFTCMNAEHPSFPAIKTAHTAAKNAIAKAKGGES